MKRLPAQKQPELSQSVSEEVSTLGGAKKLPSARYLRHLEEAADAVPREKTKPQRSPRRLLRGSPAMPTVYFIQAQTLGLIKIGVTMDVGDRLKTLQVGSPDRLELIGAIRQADAERLEDTLHTRFKAHRSHGEWFRPAAEILALVAEWSVERMEEEARDDLRAGLRAAYGGRPMGSAS